MATKAFIPKITVHDKVYAYAAALVGATRKSPDLKLGASPLTTIALIRAAHHMPLIGGS